MPSKYVRERMLMKNKPRKVLNLEERVLAIRLYQQTPVYQRVASVFKCSWEQIKNVVRNSDEILQYYKRCQVIESKDSSQFVRYKKINFLGNAMYEFIKRAYYHRSATLNNETLRKKALQFRDILKIEKFYPNKAWVADFKHVFNIDFQRLQSLIIHEPPHKSLDCNDIVAHCTRTVELSLACRGQRKTAKRAAGSGSNADDYDSDEEDSENADDGKNMARFDQDDSEDVPVVVDENDSFKDQYLDDEDADDDDINENEEGPTIDFGAYEYGVEMQELSATTPTPPPAAATKTTTVTAPPPASSPMRTELQAARSPAAAVQIKVECCSRSPSPLNDTAMPPPANRSAHRRTSTATVEPSSCKTETSKANTTTTTTTTTGSVSSYAEALQWLRPLEDFACQEEDFQAVNLLAQLAQIYERRAKRPKTFHRAS